MTYGFGRLHGLGTLPWHKSEITGQMVGNPSVSDTVSSYMVSLRGRKVQAGETATSAHAITPDILMDMYDFNHKPAHWDIKNAGYFRRNKKGDVHAWGGGRTRRLLGAAYTLSFLCLLWFDEVLKIQMQHIEFISAEKMKVTLPFRKTHQFGDIKPFYLYRLPEDKAHLCPVRAMAEWLKISGIKRGYVFRRMYSGDRIADLDKDMSMTSEQFLELFRNNLLDVGIDHYPYGTHSF